MRGAADFLMDRLAAAEEDWYHSSLNNIDEATFWRALLAARKGDTYRRPASCDSWAVSSAAIPSP
jgi:1,2-phenylacetyl-CoA epoxidase PaaB subunit